MKSLRFSELMLVDGPHDEDDDDDDDGEVE